MTQTNPLNRFNFLEKKIFIFFSSAILLVVALSVAVAYKQDYFTKMTTLYLFSDNATGIKSGMAVKLLGFNIGKIEDISIEPSAKVQVKITIRVQSEYMRYITQDARAKLFKEGMIGESVIDITPGSPELRQLAHNSKLTFDRGHDLAEIANELYGKVQPILNGLNQTISSVNNPEGDVQQSLRNVNQATRNLQSLSNDLAKQSPPILDDVGHITTAVKDSLPRLIENSNQSLDNIRSATGDIKRVTAASAQELPPALRDGRALVKGSLSIVNGVKETWPVRNMIEPPQEQPLLLDSYVQPPSAR